MAIITVAFLRPAGLKFRYRLFATYSLRDLLAQVEQGSLSADQAWNQVSENTFQVLESYANLDHTRSKRTGFPEAVFAEGKTARQVAAILDDMARHTTDQAAALLATRVTAEQYKDISAIPLQFGKLQYHEIARIVTMHPHQSSPTPPSLQHRVVVVTAGTTDLPVAEEAAVTLEAAGCTVDRVADAGVAGLHRILNALPRLQHPDVRAVIVCAGMDGALPSVVAGLVQVPVLAVPTSVGYGASFGGVSALLTMLNSCSPGVAVLNIDNGFGAAALAFKILKQSSKPT